MPPKTKKTPSPAHVIYRLPRWFRGLPLTFVLLTTGCTLFPNYNAENFSNAGAVTYIDKDGHPLPPETLSFDLAQAPFVEYEGKRFQTMAGKTAALVPSLKRIAPDYKHRYTLRLPINRRSAMVTNWTAVRLANGKIFIAGGCVQPSTDATDHTWLLDPSTGRASQECQLQVARSGEQLTLLADGRVFISGGCPSSAPSPPLASWELYDPTSSTITLAGPMCRPRDDQGVGQLSNGDVLLVGGHTTERCAIAGSDLTNTAEIVQVNTGKSRIAGRLLMPSTNAVVVPYGTDQAVVIGGFHQNSRGDYRWIHGAEIFDGDKK